jgi:cell wall-associated NlpC family hydrolase
MHLPRLIIVLAALAAAPAWANPAQNAAVLAQQYIGTPYHYGGASPKGFDCSGLVQYVYARAGIDVPRTVLHQIADTTPVNTEELQPGDLLFFRLRNGRRLHVGIYLGENTFVHAPSRGKRVTHAELTPYWKARMTGAGRISTTP